MSLAAVVRGLEACRWDPADTRAGRAEKGHRFHALVHQLDRPLDRNEPGATVAFRLAQLLHEPSLDPSVLDLAARLARCAHRQGHAEAGRLLAGCVDRQLLARGRTQRYGTVRPVHAGEAIFPAVESGVTDDERAALGLPPLAEVRAEVAAANLAAARSVATHGLPEGAALGRVARALEPTVLRSALADRTSAVWRDDGDIVFCWRGSAAAVTVWFGITMPMTPVQGTDLWVLTVRVRDLDRALFSYAFWPQPSTGPAPERSGPTGTWRGPAAPPPPERTAALVGTVERVEVDSAALGASRTLEVYRPPGHDGRAPTPVLYATDGRTSADLIDPLIVGGHLPPLIAIGVPCGTEPNEDRRAQEYLPDVHPARFAAHRRFFVDELSAWAESALGATTDRAARAVFGVSNGAVFAAEMGAAPPEHFGIVIAFSLGILPAKPCWFSGAPRHYLCAGTLEEGFCRSTRLWAERARAAGADVLHREHVSGHDPALWETELPYALRWAFGGTQPPPGR